MMKQPDFPAETVVIGTNSSRCNNCGKECDPKSKTHDVIIGYSGSGEAGCGIEWKYVASSYVGPEALLESIKGMRPDLEYIESKFMKNMREKGPDVAVREAFGKERNASE